MLQREYGGDNLAPCFSASDPKTITHSITHYTYKQTNVCECKNAVYLDTQGITAFYESVRIGKKGILNQTVHRNKGMDGYLPFHPTHSPTRHSCTLRPRTTAPLPQALLSYAHSIAHRTVCQTGMKKTCENSQAFFQDI